MSKPAARKRRVLTRSLATSGRLLRRGLLRRPSWPRAFFAAAFLAAGASRSRRRRCVVDHEARDDVGVDVGVRATVLEVALLLARHVRRGCAPTRHGRRRRRRTSDQWRGLVRAGEAVLDADAVVEMCSLTFVPSASRARDDGVVAAARAHLLGREVGVGAGAVPVARDRASRRSSRRRRTPRRCARAASARPRAGRRSRPAQHADLELPLAHHHLGVRAFDADPAPGCRPACAPRRCRARASWTRRRRSSTGPGVRGSRRRASRRGDRPGRTCTPARCRTSARSWRRSWPRRRPRRACWSRAGSCPG